MGLTRRRPLERASAALSVWALTLIVDTLLMLAATSGDAAASKSEWSMFEDVRYLVNTDTATRQQTLDEIKALGADTLRVGVGWDQVAPSPGSKSRPDFDATDPGAYPGFAAFDDLVTRATTMGFRVLITLAPPAPRWATRGGRGGNFEISSSDFANFATAVGRRYSGGYQGLPAVGFWSLWNEPNHSLFIKPRVQAPRIYRRMIDKAIPTLRRSAPAESKIFVGELAPVGTDTKVIGPKSFLQKWLCLDSSFRRLRGAKAATAGCRSFKKVKADGFAHHPYGAQAARTHPPTGRDIINISVISRLSKALDAAARAGRISARLPIYDTEFGFQSSPPDPFVGISLANQARLINEAEEISYRNGRIKSYAQYQMYDDPPRSGSAAVKWAGFQTGLRLTNGTRKPSYEAYRCPVVVHRRGNGVKIWGRVRPGTGQRLVQLQRRSGGRFVDDGSPFRTNSLGYFNVSRPRRATYRFVGYVLDPATGAQTAVGTSRSAKPIG